MLNLNSFKVKPYESRRIDTGRCNCWKLFPFVPAVISDHFGFTFKVHNVVEGGGLILGVVDEKHVKYALDNPTMGVYHGGRGFGIGWNRGMDYLEHKANHMYHNKMSASWSNGDVVYMEIHKTKESFSYKVNGKEVLEVKDVKTYPKKLFIAASAVFTSDFELIEYTEFDIDEDQIERMDMLKDEKNKEVFCFSDEEKRKVFAELKTPSTKFEFVRLLVLLE